MSNLDKALEWAKNYTTGGYLPGIDGPWAAAEIIQSLPDQWIDAEQLKVIIEDMRDSLEVEATTDFSKGFDNATTTWLDPLKNLLAPKLPTLADMTAEEQKACQWMQARYSCSDYDHVIVRVWQGRAELLRKDDGLTFDAGHASITPLPGPKLKWPGSEPPVLPEGMRLADHPDFGRVVVSPWADNDEKYKVFFRDEDGHAGADSYYAKKRNLTFLDGGK